MKTQGQILAEINSLFQASKKYNEFTALFPFNQIFETKDYYFKKVNMFGNKELRLFKNSLRVTTKTI
jgi:hypothetical protein